MTCKAMNAEARQSSCCPFLLGVFGLDPVSRIQAKMDLTAVRGEKCQGSAQAPPSAAAISGKGEFNCTLTSWFGSSVMTSVPGLVYFWADFPQG